MLKAVYYVELRLLTDTNHEALKTVFFYGCWIMLYFQKKFCRGANIKILY